jgi:phosphoesterase RecJ-like protein
MTIDWEPLRPIIHENQRFVLSSHVRPDADALGSELALAGLLEGLGKSVRIVNPSEKPEHLKFLDPGNRCLKLGHGITAAEAADADVHVILDTSAWQQLVDVGRVIKQSSATKVVIDHHVSSEDLGAIEFKDTSAAATGELVFRMAEALELPITTEVASALFCAIATDTGWFRFASTSSETLRIAARLIDLGVRPNLLYQELYERYSWARVKLAGRVLSRVTVACEGRLAYTSVELADFAATGAKPADTEDLVNECLRIDGTQCAFIAVEQQNGNVKISFRSRSDVNVAQVAELYGGGGHKQASGAMLPGPLSPAIDKILATMRSVLEPQPPASKS